MACGQQRVKRAMTVVVSGERDGCEMHRPEAVVNFFESDIFAGQRRRQKQRPVFPRDAAVAGDEAHIQMPE